MVQVQIYSRMYLHSVEPVCQEFPKHCQAGSVGITYFYFHCFLMYCVDTDAESLWLDLWWPPSTYNCTLALAFLIVECG